jgi:membrane protein
LRNIVRSPKALWGLLKDSVAAWSDDYAQSMGAALSYYTVFSIAPLLLIVIAIAGLIFGREAASGQIFAQVQGLLGEQGAAVLQDMVKSASSPGRSAFATIIGFITLIVGATTVFAELQTSLDRIWEAPAAENKEGIWNLIRARILSFGMVLAVGFLLLISLIVSAALSALGSWWAPLFGGFEVLLHIVNFIVSLAIVTVLFALIYKFLPRVKIGWHDVWIGAFATALLFTLGKFLIGLYIGKSSVASGFGAAGSLVVVLLWVYYSAQIFLLGAEFTWVYAYRYGSRQGGAKREAPAQRPSSKPASAPAPAATTTVARRASPVNGRVAQPLRIRNSEKLVRQRPKVHVDLAFALAGIAALATYLRRRARPRPPA